MLTEEQQQIVSQSIGNRVVYAGPGSGKTRVLTEHILHLLQQRTVAARQVMAVTFTRQAATELTLRLAARGGLPGQRQMALRVGTFHAQIFRAMMESTSDIPLILRPAEQHQLMRRALAGTRALSTMGVQGWLGRIGKIKSCWPPVPLRRNDKDVFQRYEQLKRTQHRWDFDDILLAFCRATERADEHIWRPFQAIRYLLVDEFQDTNPVQWHIVRALHTRLGIPVYVTGDDDQSIYGFRGATPGWLLTFPDIFQDVDRFHLSCNFRSDGSIVHAASTLIAHNRLRVAKSFTVASAVAGVCDVVDSRNEQEEATAVIAHIESVLARHPEASIALLARTRRQLQHTFAACPPALRKRIQFRTFHDAKGKEWDCVCIVGAVADCVADVLQRPAVEEERRTFYVAMTRARHELHVHVPQRADGRRRDRSPFVAESGLRTGEARVD